MCDVAVVDYLIALDLGINTMAICGSPSFFLGCKLGLDYPFMLQVDATI